MQTVKILGGGYGHKENGRTRLITRGGVCNVDDAEASRLIDLGVAALVVATPAEAVAPSPSGENTSEAENAPDASEGLVEARLDCEQLQTMTNAQLKKLAEDMGLNPGKCKKKADYIDLITSAPVWVDDEEIDDGELPPDLSAEDPV